MSSITYVQLMKLTGVKRTALYKRIKMLKDSGTINREGGRPGGKWIIIE